MVSVLDHINPDVIRSLLWTAPERYKTLAGLMAFLEDWVGERMMTFVLG